MGYFGDNGRKLGVDIVQVEYIRLELIEQSGELCPDFTGAEWAAQRLDYSQPGGEFNLARIKMILNIENKIRCNVYFLGIFLDIC